MFSFLAKIFKKRPSNFERGYKYAATYLKREGVIAIYFIESFIEKSRCFGDYDDFDKGCEKAIEDFENKVLK